MLRLELFKVDEQDFRLVISAIQLHCEVTIHHLHKNNDIIAIQCIKFQEEGPEIINESDQDSHTKS